jgi:hypothetical protein
MDRCSFRWAIQACYQNSGIAALRSVSRENTQKVEKVKNRIFCFDNYLFVPENEFKDQFCRELFSASFDRFPGSERPGFTEKIAKYKKLAL